MARAKKLPSGNWRARAYSHTTPDGKKHYESFTASTKQEAEMLAAKFSNSRSSYNIFDLTVSTAIDKYIDSKTNVLSPSTIRGYRQVQGKYFDSIGNMKVKKLTSKDIQFFISDLSAKLSSKTVKNIYGLLTASIALFAPDIHFRVTLPMKEKTLSESPSESDVMALYDSAQEWLKKCIALGAFGGLRRGEISALKFKDIQNNSIYVHADFVLDEYNVWHYKPMPKTVKSVRTVKLPGRVIELLGTGSPDAYVVGVMPDKITKGFYRLKENHKIDIRFHDLRHYYASIGSILGIPDFVMADFGGWEHDSKSLKQSYQGNIKSITDGYSKKLNDHFDTLIENV